MEREAKPTWDYIELLLFILGWLGLFFFLVALIFAHHLGLITALKVSIGYWIFIIIVFLSIIFVNLLFILLKKTIKYIRSKNNDSVIR